MDKETEVLKMNFVAKKLDKLQNFKRNLIRNRLKNVRIQILTQIR